MLVSAPRRQPTTRVVALTLAIFGCSHKASPPAPRDAAVAVVPARPPALRQAPARTGLARRCVLGGDPLTSDCTGGGAGIAFGADGTLYLVDDRAVRRYRRQVGEGCLFEPSGQPIAMPADNPRPQSIDGPVYMRSGGAAWHLARVGDAVYAHDFLGGLVRVDRGKPEPACSEIFGFDSVAAVGGHLLVGRKGVEELRIGARCKVTPVKLDDAPRGRVFGANGHLFVGNGSKLARYDGTAPHAVAAELCYVNTVTACGDGACVLDSNCPRLVQLGDDGTLVRKLDSDALFATRPWSLADAITDDAGDVLVLARHRDDTNGKAICEAAVYEVPAAAFAR